MLNAKNISGADFILERIGFCSILKHGIEIKRYPKSFCVYV